MLPSFATARDLEEIDARLAHAPGDVDLLFRRACVLDMLGRADEAKDAYLAVVKERGDHTGALGNLGLLLYNAGYRNAALATYYEALKHDPRDARTLVNLAYALLEANDLDDARGMYLRALEIEPESAPAHQGLGNVLERLGEPERAAEHRRRGFEAMPIVVNPFRGEATPVSVLLLCAAYRGNVPVEVPLDDRTFMIVKLFTEFYDLEWPLPPHDVIFNGIGDADLCAGALDAAQRLLEKHGAVAVNPPERVRATGRLEIARRMRGIAGVAVPHIEELEKDELERITRYPVLLRAPGYHGGAHFELANDREEAMRAVSSFPGNRLFAIEPLDARSRDGLYRKYRAIAVGGTLYPIHLARSSQWKVHYFSADRAGEPEAIAEEARFLTDMQAAIGERAMRALEEIVRRTGLDYVGIDFSLDREGNVLLFEANATMRAQPLRPAALAANAALRELVLHAAT